MKVNDKLLKELFRGNIVPSNSFTFKTENYISAREQDDKLYTLLVGSLDNNQKELLDDLLEAKAKMSDETILGAFKDGFKLGMGLTVEGLSSDYFVEE